MHADGSLTWFHDRGRSFRDAEGESSSRWPASRRTSPRGSRPGWPPAPRQNRCTSGSGWRASACWPAASRTTSTTC
ncbi:MAG: hypothetical protein IPK12_20505 [Gemmatimonadetes bacterium]|nr:hypothetical protein [Gemmatimonadota bacterium]